MLFVCFSHWVMMLISYLVESCADRSCGTNDAINNVPADVSAECRKVLSKPQRQQQQPECVCKDDRLWLQKGRKTIVQSFSSSTSPGRHRPSGQKTYSSGYKTQEQRGRTAAAVKLWWAAEMIQADNCHHPQLWASWQVSVTASGMIWVFKATMKWQKPFLWAVCQRAAAAL